MFRRTEESEWSRFSKALTGKDEKEGNGTTDESITAVETPEPTASSEVAAVSATAAASPTSRPPTTDSNLTVSRTAASQTPVESDDVESIVGQHTFFDGTYRSDASVRILGTAQGEVDCKRAVFVEENAKVDAKITAANVTVAGQVNGEINCTGRVEIRPTGRVTGTINAGTLIMQEGAFFDGNLRMKQTSPEAAAAS
ncbi:MAG: hypothetical protein QOF51_2285 [Chloroflexota bacterium]|jgi:cytoskeletal protein CcmA (bactofilin family)|nr:hypothetical protein [Chloroflexota bacterium]